MKLVAFFIRHGETDLNNPPDGSEEKFRGDADVPLNKEGQEQAEDLTTYLKGYRISAIYTSGKHRTMQTAAPLGEAKGIEPKQLKNFDSLDTGEFTGLPKNEENRKRLAYYRENPDEPIPGGESVQAFRNRVDPIILNVIKIGETSGAPAAAVVHGSVMREVARLFGPNIDKEGRSENDPDFDPDSGKASYDSLKVDPGGIVGIMREEDGVYTAMPLVNQSESEEDMDKAGS